MRAVIRDREALLEIPPNEVAAYLRARNWNLVDRDGEKNRWSVWTLGDLDAPKAEILLPHDQALGDFALRMSDVLSVLESAEERSQIDILRDIQTSTGDIIRIQANGTDVYGGAIQLESGVSLIQSAHDMMAASACAAIEPKPYFHLARKPIEAQEYLQKAYLGQTEQGSYVVTVISKIPPDVNAKQVPMAFGEEREPFPRRVTMTLAKAVDRVKSAAEATVLGAPMDAFSEAVPDGVSANLCDALASMGDPKSGSVNIGVSWAPSRPLAEPLPNWTNLPHGMMPVIKEAARVLKTQQPLEGIPLHGKVVGLDRPTGAPSGTIKVETRVAGQLRVVRIDLSDSEYHAATMAHDEERSVNLVGTVVKEGRFYVLKAMRHFSVE